MLNKNQVLSALSEISGLPVSRRGGSERTIYEGGDDRGRGTGKFYITFASFPGGTSDEVPRSVIAELEREGKIKRAFPIQPEIEAWRVASLPDTKEPK